MKSRKKIREGIDTLEVLKKHFPYIYTKADLTRVFVSGIGTGIVVGIIFWATFAQHQNSDIVLDHQHLMVKDSARMF